MNDTEKYVELLAWAKQGIHECFSSSRGANMFGAGAQVKAIDNSTLEIKTRDAGADPTYWELKLTKKI